MRKSKQVKAAVSHSAPAPSKKRRCNRSAGHQYERDCVKELRDIGFEHVVTSRSESVSRDACKVDIMNRDEYVNGRLPYNIQCKNSANMVSYHELHKEIQKVPGVINVIFHQLVKGGKVNGVQRKRFNTLGQYAILNKEDFLLMIKELHVFSKQQEELVKENNTLREEILKLRGKPQHLTMF